MHEVYWNLVNSNDISNLPHFQGPRIFCAGGVLCLYVLSSPYHKHITNCAKAIRFVHVLSVWKTRRFCEDFPCSLRMFYCNFIVMLFMFLVHLCYHFCVRGSPTMKINLLPSLWLGRKSDRRICLSQFNGRLPGEKTVIAWSVMAWCGVQLISPWPHTSNKIWAFHQWGYPKMDGL